MRIEENITINQVQYFRCYFKQKRKIQIQKELLVKFVKEIMYFPYFSTVVPSNSCAFLSSRSFVVNTTFSTGLDTRPIENVVLTTKGLRKETHNCWMGRRCKTCWKCCINNERPTGNKHTTVGWNDGGKIGTGKIIN